MGSRARIGRAAVAVAVPALYFSYVFRLWSGQWLKAGLGDWIDPYFINFILEHWHHSLWHLTDPASPPMYFPAGGTLGYSCGLILYAPFYILVRPFLHPFAADTMALFLAFETGSVCLYVCFRRCLALGFLESLVICVFFFTSSNVINSGTGTWSQTDSVFVIPPILLLASVSARMAPGRLRIGLGATAGLLATLLFTQDFYTGAFALLFAVLLLPARAGLVAFWVRERSWALAFLAGAFCGGLIFLWCYVVAHREHPVFPAYQLMEAITRLDKTRWHSLADVLRDANSFHSLRSFELFLAMGLLACIPWLRIEWRTRGFILWCVVVSFVAFIMPLRTSHFSIWRQLFARIPGFEVVRDPRKVIYEYELAAALMAGMVLARLSRASRVRMAVVVAILALTATDWNREVFSYARTMPEFDRWVEAPIAIDPSCRSFFIKGASDDYMSRSGHMWSLYGMDAGFIALQHGLPTLNGYSAWGPEGWGLANPQGPGYDAEVARWISTHELRNVCQFDIDARTMTPYDPPHAR